MGSSEGAPTPKSVNSNAAGAGPSFGMGWNAPAATGPSIQIPKVQAPTVQTPNTSLSSGSLSGAPSGVLSGPVPGSENRGLNPTTGYQPYTPRSISVGGEGAARIRAEAGTTIGTKQENQPALPKPSTLIPERDNGSQPTGQPKRWTAPSEKRQPAVSPKEPVLNPYGYSARPEETGRSVDKVAHKPLDQAHRPLSGAIRSTATPRPARSAEDQAVLQREADAVARVARYDDYYDHARRALQDGGEAAIPELREIARLHSLAVGKSDPQAARQFDAGINREIAAYRANAAEQQASVGANAGANDGEKGGLESSQVKIGLGDPGAYNPARYQKRKDEDYPTAQARIAGAIAQDQEAAEKRRFAEGSETYAAAKEKAGVTITRAPDAEPVLDFGDGVRLEGLDTTGTKRLAEAMAQDPAIADDIRKVLSGDLSVEDIEDRLAELGAFDKTSLGPRRRSRNQGAIDRELALLDVVEGQASGASKADMAETLVNAYAPDREEDLARARDLLLDMLPIIGEVRSAQDAVTDFTAMTKAIEAGNWKLAGQNGLFAVLATAGAVPGVGKVAKLARTALVRGLRTTAGGRKLVVGVRLAKFERQFPKKFKSFDTKELIQGIPEADQKAVQLLLNMSMGDATEREVVQAMREAGFTVYDDYGARAVGKIDKTAKRSRIYDASTPEGVDNLFGLVWRPDRDKLGTAYEVKSGSAKLDVSQRKNDGSIPLEMPTARPHDAKEYTLHSVKYLRVRLDQISPRHLELAIQKRLDTAVRNGKLSPYSSEIILTRAMAYQAQSSERNPIPVIGLAAMIRGAISAETLE